MANEPSEWRKQVTAWTCNHFSVHSAEGNTRWLLQELASRIAELGNIDVLDVVLSHEQGDQTEGITGTIYFSFAHQTVEDGRGSDQVMTLGVGYLAMYYFVKAYFDRGGRRDGSVTLLTNDLGPSLAPDGVSLLTTDPAFWDDWLDAVKKARLEGVPKEL